MDALKNVLIFKAEFSTRGEVLDFDYIIVVVMLP